MIGVPKNLQSTLSAASEDKQKTDAIIQACFPVRPRSKGILFDIFVSNPDMDNYPFEQVSVPTLILHAKDDPLSSFEKVKTMAQRIPNARLVQFETGGHVLLGHRREVQVEMREFIADGS
jgi:pimeloyl-ACP methyl ester carboxylesterase